MDFVPQLALASLVYSMVNLARYVRARDWDGSLTIAVSYAIGVAAVMITAQTDWASAIDIGDRTLGGLNAWSQLLAGLTLASSAGVVADLKKAIDRTDTAVKPSLLNGEREVPGVNLTPEG